MSSLPLYVLAAAYAAYYGLIAGLSLAGTAWPALIPLWLLALAAWTASSRPTRWRLPCLLTASLITALLTRPALGLGKTLPGTAGVLALGAVYFALVANPCVSRLPALKPWPAFLGTAVAFLAYYGASIVKSPADTVFSNAFLGFHGLLGLVGLFWFWVGLDLFNGAQDLAEWLVVTARNVASRRLVSIGVFVLWTLWCAASYLLAHGPSARQVEILARYGWGQALVRTYGSLEPSMVLLTAMDYGLYLTAGIGITALVLLLLRRLPYERLLTLFGLSVIGFVSLLGGFSLFFGFAEQSGGGSLGFWPILIFAAGMLWESFQVGSGLLSDSRRSSMLFLGFLLLLGGISVLELSAGYPLFEQEIALNTFLGFLYLGLPYLLYTSLYQQQRYTPVSSKHLTVLFVLGMACAIPALLLNRLAIVPALWLACLLATVWRWGKWDELQDGITYGIALALGFVVFYTHPVFIPIPAFTGLLGRFLELQARYAETVIWPWDGAWWRLLAGAVLAAVVLGFLSAYAHRSRGRTRLLLLAAAVLASTAIVAGCEFLLL